MEVGVEKGPGGNRTVIWARAFSSCPGIGGAAGWLEVPGMAVLLGPGVCRTLVLPACNPQAPAAMAVAVTVVAAVGLGARAPCQAVLSLPGCPNWALGTRLVPGACSAWGGW